MNLEQLSSLGLTALGDIVTLRQFCAGETAAAPTVASACSMSSPNETLQPSEQGDSDSQPSSGQDRRRRLLSLLQEMESKKGSKPKRLPGRPKCTVKPVTAGLRLKIKSRRKAVKHSGFKQVKSPLGDKTLITLKFEMNSTYAEMLQEMKQAFFPHGANPVIGEVADYHVEIVNTANVNINSSTDDMTLEQYLTEKRISGAVRLHLLCTPLLSSDEELTTNQTTGDTDLDSLPDLSTLNEPDLMGDLPAFFLNVTDSGEVALRVSTPKEVHGVDAMRNPNDGVATEILSIRGMNTSAMTNSMSSPEEVHGVDAMRNDSHGVETEIPSISGMNTGAMNNTTYHNSNKATVAMEMPITGTSNNTSPDLENLPNQV